MNVERGVMTVQVSGRFDPRDKGKVISLYLDGQARYVRLVDVGHVGATCAPMTAWQVRWWTIGCAVRACRRGAVRAACRIVDLPADVLDRRNVGGGSGATPTERPPA